MPGRILFADWATESAIEERVHSGATIKGTRLTGSFDWQAFRDRNPESLVMAVVRDGVPTIVAADQPASGRPGDVVISLTAPATTTPSVAPDHDDGDSDGADDGDSDGAED